MNSSESTNTLDEYEVVNAEDAVFEGAPSAAPNPPAPAPGGAAAGSKTLLPGDGKADLAPQAPDAEEANTADKAEGERFFLSPQFTEEGKKPSPGAPAPASPAPSAAAAPGDDGDGNDSDASDATSTHDLVFEGDHGGEEDPDLNLTETVMRMAGLGLQGIEGFDSDDDDDDEEDDHDHDHGGSRGSGDDVHDHHYDLDLGSEHDDDLEHSDCDSDDEAEVRAQVDAELEMNLRRSELRHVELELKLVSAEEDVRKAKEALAQAEGMREVYQKQAHVAWEHVGEAERLIADERLRREEEDAARYLAERQAQAIVEADDLRQKGNEAYRQGKCGEAEALYKMAIDELEMCQIVLEEPSHLTLRTNRAAALMALGRTREALSECEMVLEINPCNIRALSRAANCCIKLGDLAAAKNHVDDICLSPDANAADLQAAADQHQKILAASVERDRLVGNDAYRRGDYVGALRWYDAALTAAKDAKETESLKTIRVGLHTNRAAAHLMVGHPLPAAEDCCAALRLDSAHSKAQVRLARCLLQLGDFAEARQEATDVTARVNAELQSKSEARVVIKDIEAVEGALAEVGDKLKAAEESLRQPQDDENVDVHATAVEALVALDAAMLIAPQVPDLITLKAEAMRLVGKAEDALALIAGKKAINARRRFVEVRVQFDLGNIAACVEAGEQLANLLQMVPEFIEKKKQGDEGKKDGGDDKVDVGKDDDEDTINRMLDEKEEDDKIKELAAVPDPEGLLVLLDKATKISKCKEDGRDAFLQGRHTDALGLYTEALLKSGGAPMLEVGLYKLNPVDP
jgi:DnaJ family protein C protein 7